MTKRSIARSREPVALRLERLLGVLASRASWTGPELAIELGVSLRTVRRDLAMLGERGVPLEAERGRGGGVRIPARAGIGRLQLGHREVLDLLLALAIVERLQSPLLLSSVRGLRQKIARAFPAEERKRVAGLRRRILHGRAASSAVAASWSAPRPSILEPIQDAFFEQRALEVIYQSGSRTRRVIEPQYLLLNWPAWYLLVWDHLRGAPRSLRLDRIVSAEPTGAPFRLREFSTLVGADPTMEGVGAFFSPL